MNQILVIIFLFSTQLVSVAKESHLRPTANRQRPTANDLRPTSELNRPAFYKAMEENNKTLVNDQLSELENVPDGVRQAFKGAMLMKKAGFRAPPAVKLRLFKQGHKMLEAAIRQEPDNAEYRFLRLIVQEHAPGALGYKNDVQSDCEYIRKSYKSLPDEVQHAIANYSKKSKYLKLEVS